MDLMTTTLRAAMQTAREWAANLVVADKRPMNTLAVTRPLRIRMRNP